MTFNNRHLRHSGLTLICILALPLLVQCGGMQTVERDMETVTVSGEMLYREKILLQPGALVWVFVEKVEAAGGAPSRAIAAQQVREPETQVPIPFELTFDVPASSDPHVYQLHSFITDQTGRTMWVAESKAIDPKWLTGPMQMLVRRPAGKMEELAGNAVSYSCNGMTFHANVHEDFALLLLPDERVVLPPAVSASGARYTNGAITYWSQGKEATVEVGGERYDGCTEKSAGGPWEDARHRGIEFRAVGQEPGWYLEIDEGKQILFVADYGTREITTPVPSPTTIAGGQGREYHAQTEAHDLKVRIVRKPCADVMSGERFPLTVTVTLDGKTYDGCGRRLAQW